MPGLTKCCIKCFIFLIRGAFEGTPKTYIKEYKTHLNVS